MYIGLDRGHPLVRGMISAHPLTYPSNRYVYDRINNVPCPVTNAVIDGQALVFSGEPYRYADITVPKTIGLDFPLTLVCSAKPDPTSTGPRIVLCMSSGENLYDFLSIGYEMPGGFTLQIRWSTGTFIVAGTPSGGYDQIIGVFASPTDRRLYANGELIDTDDREHDIDPNLPINHAILGCAMDSNGHKRHSFEGHIDYAYIYNRALSESEIRSLYQDPYQMYIKTDTPDMYSLVGDGSGIFAGLPGAGVHITDRWGNAITSPVLLERWG